MILNKAEFLLMNNPIRAFIQERYEIPILRSLTTSKILSTVLEIGCGNGNGTRLIKNYFNPEQIIAIDLDDKMIEIAHKRNDDGSIDFRVMNAAKLEFPDNAFDAVFDFGIIHHIANWRDCICEVKRVLKDDGELILEELAIESFSGFPGILWKSILLHPYEDMYTFTEFEKYLEVTGFSIRDKKYSNPMKILEHISLTAGINRMKNG